MLPTPAVSQIAHAALPRKTYTSSVSSDVQFGHLQASIDIEDMQYGHFFVSGDSGGPLRLNIFICEIRMKIANAIIRKLTTLLMKMP